MGNKNIFTIEVFSSTAIEGSGNSVSEIINLKSMKPDWRFGFQSKVAGAGGTVTFTYSLSIDGETYVAGDTAIVVDQPVGSDINSFASGEPILANFMKITATETAGNPVIVDGVLAVQ